MSARALAVGFFLTMTACSVQPVVDDGASASRDEAARVDCAAVLCALPECTDGQELVTRGGCCPTCAGRPSRCATVLCAAVACAEGEQLVTTPGDCCGHCVKTPKVAECTTNDDCPVYYCIQCPCPYSECVGRKCVTRTPDASTCGSPTL
jgi:hypothetical protein